MKYIAAKVLRFTYGVLVVLSGLVVFGSVVGVLMPIYLLVWVVDSLELWTCKQLGLPTDKTRF